MSGPGAPTRQQLLRRDESPNETSPPAPTMAAASATGGLEVPPLQPISSLTEPRGTVLKDELSGRPASCVSAPARRGPLSPLPVDAART
jgi:hypothetical protein